MDTITVSWNEKKSFHFIPNNWSMSWFSVSGAEAILNPGVCSKSDSKSAQRLAIKLISTVATGSVTLFRTHCSSGSTILVKPTSKVLLMASDTDLGSLCIIKLYKKRERIIAEGWRKKSECSFCCAFATKLRFSSFF